MNKSKSGLRIGALVVIAIILLIPTGFESESFAEEKKDKRKINSVSDIALTVVFHFRSMEEVVKTFEVFTQDSGYVRNAETPRFSLQGIVGGDKIILYEATDTTYYQGGGDQNHEYSEFDVDIVLHNGEKSYRKFTYVDCHVEDYSVTTDFDDEEAWSGDKKFAFVDNFEFECRGFQISNPIYQQMLHDEKIQHLESVKKSMRK